MIVELPALIVSLALLAMPARADECEDLCHQLDAIEEGCEAEFGDGHTVCEAIGTVEETCDDEDDGDEDGEEEDGEDEDGEEEDGEDEDDDEAQECADLCAQVPALIDTCTAELGADHVTCQDLTAFLEADCAGAGGSARLGASAACAVGGVAGGGTAILLAAASIVVRRRRQG